MSKVVLVLILSILYFFCSSTIESEEPDTHWLSLYKRQFTYYFGDYTILNNEKRRYPLIGSFTHYDCFSIQYEDHEHKRYCVQILTRELSFEQMILEECKGLAIRQFKNLSESTRITVDLLHFCTDASYYEKILNCRFIALNELRPCNFFAFFPTVYLFLCATKESAYDDQILYLHRLMKETNGHANYLFRSIFGDVYVKDGIRIECKDLQEYEDLLGD